MDSVIADLKDKLQYSRGVIFVDNLFEGDLQHAREILERIIAEKLRPSLTVFCRSSIGKRPEMLKLMKRAGVMRIFVGVESLNQESLDHANKGQSVSDVELAVHTIREHGICVHATMVMGFDTDTLASLQATRRMLGKLGMSQMNVFSLWGYYPNQDDRLTPIERMIFKDWGHLNGSYVCHFPLRIKPSMVQREIMAAHDDTFCSSQMPGDMPRWSGPEEPWQSLYKNIWQTIRPSMVEYIPFLEQTEQGYYDENDNLLVEKLPSRSDLDNVRQHLS